MIFPEANHRFFNTSAELQEFLLTQTPGSLVIVPHMRLAHQVWRRQRLSARAAGRAAWEPVAMTTLSGWFQRLWKRLWLPKRPAATMERLVLWLKAMAEVPAAEEISFDLSWATLLDETYDLCQRYRLLSPTGLDSEPPLIAWRQAVFQNFETLLAERNFITAAAMPSFLLKALEQKALTLPEQIITVGLETPAPAEQQWLNEVARQRLVLQIKLAGRQESDLSLRGVAFPDRRQELEWVAAQVLELAHNQGVPLHRLAITAPNLETYLPELRRIWQELLGPAVSENGGRYNFSLGSTLAETQLFQAALVPLKFILAGEQRQDLMGWLRSPFYGAFGCHENTFLRWDIAWRESGVVFGWQQLNRARTGNGRPEIGAEAWALVDGAYSRLPAEPVPASAWHTRLLEIWKMLKFPHGLDPQEVGQWQVCLNLLNEFAGAGGDLAWSAADLAEWLSWGAARLDLPSEGSSEAGIQVQGLLELRGLDFDNIFCLGMNMGVFPPPPRQLPLLTSREKAVVLGGDYQSQHDFAATSYRYLLAGAPQLILTRPLLDQEEDQLASYIIPPDIWEKKLRTFNSLSQAHPAWLRSPAVRAAFRPQTLWPGEDEPEAIAIPLPEEISLSALENALTCPCRFYLSNLLGLEALPDPEPGLTPMTRGTVIHAVLHAFTSRYLAVLQNDPSWDEAVALQLLREVLADLLPPVVDDPHWEAEMTRWLEEEEGLLQRWLEQEKQRFREGWRWLAMEESFTGMQLSGWPTKIRGRLDRVDGHQSQGVMIWDYKTGEIPKKNQVMEECHTFQLTGYLLAVQQGLVTVPSHSEARAGIIGLKSSRAEHLKFQDYKLTADNWREIIENKLLEVAKTGARVGEGDFRPDPGKAPPAPKNSCQFCPYILLCGYKGQTEGEPEE